MSLIQRALVLANQEFFTMVEGHHNTEPANFGDLLIAGIGAVITIFVLFYTIRYFVRPGEKGESHIKRRILEDEA